MQLAKQLLPASSCGTARNAKPVNRCIKMCQNHNIDSLVQNFRRLATDYLLAGVLSGAIFLSSADVSFASSEAKITVNRSDLEALILKQYRLELSTLPDVDLQRLLSQEAGSTIIELLTNAADQADRLSGLNEQDAVVRNPKSAAGSNENVDQDRQTATSSSDAQLQPQATKATRVDQPVVNAAELEPATSTEATLDANSQPNGEKPLIQAPEPNVRDLQKRTHSQVQSYVGTEQRDSTAAEGTNEPTPGTANQLSKSLRQPRRPTVPSDLLELATPEKRIPLPVDPQGSRAADPSEQAATVPDSSPAAAQDLLDNVPERYPQTGGCSPSSDGSLPSSTAGLWPAAAQQVQQGLGILAATLHDSVGWRVQAAAEARGLPGAWAALVVDRGLALSVILAGAVAVWALVAAAVRKLGCMLKAALGNTGSTQLPPNIQGKPPSTRHIFYSPPTSERSAAPPSEPNLNPTSPFQRGIYPSSEKYPPPGAQLAGGGKQSSRRSGGSTTYGSQAADAAKPLAYPLQGQRLNVLAPAPVEGGDSQRRQRSRSGTQLSEQPMLFPQGQLERRWWGSRMEDGTPGRQSNDTLKDKRHKGWWSQRQDEQMSRAGEQQLPPNYQAPYAGYRYVQPQERQPNQAPDRQPQNEPRDLPGTSRGVSSNRPLWRRSRPVEIAQRPGEDAYEQLIGNGEWSNEKGKGAYSKQSTVEKRYSNLPEEGQGYPQGPVLGPAATQYLNEGQQASPQLQLDSSARQPQANERLIAGREVAGLQTSGDVPPPKPGRNLPAGFTAPPSTSANPQKQQLGPPPPAAVAAAGSARQGSPSTKNGGVRNAARGESDLRGDTGEASSGVDGGSEADVGPGLAGKPWRVGKGVLDGTSYPPSEDRKGKQKHSSDEIDVPQGTPEGDTAAPQGTVSNGPPQWASVDADTMPVTEREIAGQQGSSVGQTSGGTEPGGGGFGSGRPLAEQGQPTRPAVPQNAAGTTAHSSPCSDESGVEQEGRGSRADSGLSSHTPEHNTVSNPQDSSDPTLRPGVYNEKVPQNSVTLNGSLSHSEAYEKRAVPPDEKAGEDGGGSAGNPNMRNVSLPPSQYRPTLPAAPQSNPASQEVPRDAGSSTSESREPRPSSDHVQNHRHSSGVTSHVADPIDNANAPLDSSNSRTMAMGNQPSSSPYVAEPSEAATTGLAVDTEKSELPAREVAVPESFPIATRQEPDDAREDAHRLSNSTWSGNSPRGANRVTNVGHAAQQAQPETDETLSGYDSKVAPRPPLPQAPNLTEQPRTDPPASSALRRQSVGFDANPAFGKLRQQRFSALVPQEGAGASSRYMPRYQQPSVPYPAWSAGFGGALRGTRQLPTIPEVQPRGGAGGKVLWRRKQPRRATGEYVQAENPAAVRQPPAGKVGWQSSPWQQPLARANPKAALGGEPLLPAQQQSGAGEVLPRQRRGRYSSRGGAPMQGGMGGVPMAADGIAVGFPPQTTWEGGRSLNRGDRRIQGEVARQSWKDEDPAASGTERRFSAAGQVASKGKGRFVMDRGDSLGRMGQTAYSSAPTWNGQSDVRLGHQDDSLAGSSGAVVSRTEAAQYLESQQSFAGWNDEAGAVLAGAARGLEATGSPPEQVGDASAGPQHSIPPQNPQTSATKQAWQALGEQQRLEPAPDQVNRSIRESPRNLPVDGGTGGMMIGAESYGQQGKQNGVSSAAGGAALSNQFAGNVQGTTKKGQVSAKQRSSLGVGLQSGQQSGTVIEGQASDEAQQLEGPGKQLDGPKKLAKSVRYIKGTNFLDPWYT